MSICTELDTIQFTALETYFVDKLKPLLTVDSVAVVDEQFKET